RAEQGAIADKAQPDIWHQRGCLREGENRQVRRLLLDESSNGHEQRRTRSVGDIRELLWNDGGDVVRDDAASFGTKLDQVPCHRLAAGDDRSRAVEQAGIGVSVSTASG